MSTTKSNRWSLTFTAQNTYKMSCCIMMIKSERYMQQLLLVVCITCSLRVFYSSATFFPIERYHRCTPRNGYLTRYASTCPMDTLREHQQQPEKAYEAGRVLYGWAPSVFKCCKCRSSDCGLHLGERVESKMRMSEITSTQYIDNIMA